MRGWCGGVFGNPWGWLLTALVALFVPPLCTAEWRWGGFCRFAGSTGLGSGFLVGAKCSRLRQTGCHHRGALERHHRLLQLRLHSRPHRSEQRAYPISQTASPRLPKLRLPQSHRLLGRGQTHPQSAIPSTLVKQRGGRIVDCPFLLHRQGQ